MKILHLLYDLMNLYGDYANVLALEKALTGMETAVESDKLSLDDNIDFSQYDFIYIGSGTEKNQKVALEYLTSVKDIIKNALDGKTVMLCTGNSFEIFGRSITDKNGIRYEGLNFFDFDTVEGSERIVTDTKADFNGHEITGFINKASQINGIKTPFFKIMQGAGNSDLDKENEGIISGNFFGTHIIAPLLIKNKELVEYFAKLLIENDKTGGET